MADISTKYLGLTLRNPIIVGSCGLADSVDGVKDLEKNGAGAVVLKSIFEEEITLEFEDTLEKETPVGYGSEYLDYYDYQIKKEHINEYIKLIEESKKSVSIPVIASVNCIYSHEWVSFAKKLESAGADALELNMFFLPSDLTRSSEETEQTYFNIIEKVESEVSIPIALKISYYFSNLGQMIQKLADTGISGLVLFNRFWSPDFDIDKLEVTQTNVLSTPAELAISLRWIAIMAERVNCDLAASTGVHDGKAVIKQILAGARAVQVVSALYRKGIGHIQKMLNELEDWMSANEYDNLDQFRGKMGQSKSSNPAIYERVQFMKYFGGRR